MFDLFFAKSVRFILKAYHKLFYSLYEQGRYIPINKIQARLKKSSLIFIGTGGSSSHIICEELNNLLTFSINLGPYYAKTKFGIDINFWIIRNTDSLDMLFKLPGNKNIKFNDTILLIPSLESKSKISLMSHQIRRLLNEHPELKFSTFFEINQPNIDINDLKTENYYFNNFPIRYTIGGALESLLIPLSISFGVSSIYFSGIDQRQTGHFWDLDMFYQDKNGNKLEFPNQKKLIEINKWFIQNVDLINVLIFEECKKDSLLSFYPSEEKGFILKNASVKITFE